MNRKEFKIAEENELKLCALCFSAVKSSGIKKTNGR